MIVVMQPSATSSQIAAAKRALREFCSQVHNSRGADLTVLGLIGLTAGRDRVEAVASRLPGVERIESISHPYKLVGARTAPSTIHIGSAAFGNGAFGVIAGPCAVESLPTTLEIACAVQAAGASVLRGDFVKARTSPYEFPGLGEEGLRILAEVKAKTNLPFVVDVLSTSDVELALSYGADCLRVGTRYMYAAELLCNLGRQTAATVMIKRGFSATLEEWLLMAERVAMNGNCNIILCERGVRSFDNKTRNLLDIMAVDVLRSLTHLPVIVDPSHSTGNRAYVPGASRVAMAIRAAGLMVDVHPDPSNALVDGAQALLPKEFAELMDVSSALLPALGLKLS